MDGWGWAFSGIGATVVGVLLAWLITKRSKNSRRVMKQRGGRGSTNIQVGHDLNANDGAKGDDE